MSQKRIIKDGVYYHVTNHFHQGVIRFIDSKCKKMFIDLCHKARKKFNFKIKNLCVMDTHIHILIKPENCTISDIMQFIKQCFTQWLNRRHGIKARLGKLDFSVKSWNLQRISCELSSISSKIPSKPGLLLWAKK